MKIILKKPVTRERLSKANKICKFTLECGHIVERNEYFNQQRFRCFECENQRVTSSWELTG